MKRQSEAEWLATSIEYHNFVFETMNVGKKRWDFIAQQLLAALRRRGWTPPKGKVKK